MALLQKALIILFSTSVLINCTALAQDPIVGDLHEDNTINYKDLEILLDNWMDANCMILFDCTADLDGIAGVDMFDYTIFAPHWLESRVVINEFIAYNQSVPDPSGEQDWVELYNPGPNTIDLGGMYLTDNLNNLTKWQIPEGITIASEGFTSFWADGDPNLGIYHTNFRLDKDGEELAFVDIDGTTIIDSIVFGPQVLDESYGRFPDGWNHWYPMRRVTRNNKNAVSRSPVPKFSKPSCSFKDPFLLELRAEKPGTHIYYTTDGSLATIDSTEYTSPIVINTTTQVRAVAWDPDIFPSYEVNRTYIKLDPDMHNFTSNLPIVVIDTFGCPVNDIDLPDAWEFQPAVGAFIDTKKDGVAEVTGHPDYAGNMAIHVRGSSSAEFDKKQYRLEIRDLEDNDLSVPLLGLPAESDWILQAPWGDLTLMKNYQMFDWSRDIGHYSPRCVFVELFLDIDGEGAIDYGDGTEFTNTDYLGVYVLMENIKQGKNRVDIDKVRYYHDSEPEITGGYVLSKGGSDTCFTTSEYWDEICFEDPAGDDLTTAQKNWVQNYFNQFELALDGSNFDNPGHVDYYGNYIDTDSFINYHLLVELCKDVDGFELSTSLYKARNGKIFMGPLWDLNGSLGAGYFCSYDPIGWHYEFDETCMEDYGCTHEHASFPMTNGAAYEWYWRLFDDSEFLLKYADEWFSSRRIQFDTAKIMTDVDNNVDLLTNSGITGNPVERNFTRWDILNDHIWPSFWGCYTWNTTNDWSYDTGYVGWMKTWLNNRLNWMDIAIASQYCNGYPPVFNYQGGQVPVGFSLIISSAGGTIYYTLDGSDPRLHGGGISSSAFAYSAPVPLTKSVTVKARSLSGGSWTAVNSARFSVGPVKDSLRITEIMYHPKDVNDPNDPNGEFIELKNIGIDPINLNLVRFSDGIDFTFGDLALAPGAYTVIVPNISTFEDKYGTGISVAGEYQGRLNNAGEEVVIRDAIDTSILEFDYEDDWYPITDGPGFSLTVLNELNPDPNSWDSKTNWRASVDVNGSPGVDDGSPLHNPDAIIINEVLSHSDGGDPDWVELYNTTGSSINISGWFLSDDKDDLMKFEIQTMPSIPSGWYVVFDQDSHFGDEGNPGCNTAFALSENGESVYLTSGSGGELTGYSEVERLGASERGVTFGRHVTSTGK
ncbi:MAG: lamin tail domain-containing protein, partial [Planctomycetota bacterium]